MLSVFGPEYHKIHTAFKRDSRNVIIPGNWTLPEFSYLADNPWWWSEKVDGMNLRLHWDGHEVTIGGRTDSAQIPASLILNLKWLTDPELWSGIFGEDGNVTVYGEGYGHKIQSGGMYRDDQSVIVFDVLIGKWWLTRENVVSIADQLGLDVVPEYGTMTLNEAWSVVSGSRFKSHWPDAKIEGLVGYPVANLHARNGDRIITKLKVKDWTDYLRHQSVTSKVLT